MEQRSPDFEKVGRVDLACRNASRLAYHWQVATPGWRLSFAPSGDLDWVVVTLHRMDRNVATGNESIPVDDLDWRSTDADLYKCIAMVGGRLLAAWIKAQEAAAARAPAQPRAASNR